MTARELFKNVVQYIKCELTEMRETAIVAFGHANELAFRYYCYPLVLLLSTSTSTTNVLVLLVQYIKCELTEMRETAIVAFGHTNELAFR